MSPSPTDHHQRIDALFDGRSIPAEQLAPGGSR
jgi:hypothetical protein